jgi:hypothetical protein
VHIAGAGVCAITASQAGDDNFLAADDVARSFTIGKASQTISFGPLGGRTYGDPDFTVAASSSSGLAVAFAAAGACTISGTSVHITAAGSCTVTASQPGSDDYNPAPDVPQVFSVAKADQTISFAALADRVFGGDFDVSASASSGLAVTFTAGPPSRCTIAGSTVHMAGIGTCTVTASQGGDSNRNAAPPVARSFAILNSASGHATGDGLKPRTGGEASFDIQAARGHSGLSGSLEYVGVAPRKGPPLRFHAKEITAFGISADGHSAWIAGVARDGRTFRAYIEDNGAGKKGSGDVFQLWLGAALQTGDGSLKSGSVQIGA